MWEFIKTTLITCVFHKYADFKGKATRGEFWCFWFIRSTILFICPLLAFLLGDLLAFSLGKIVTGILLLVWGVFSLGLLCPYIAVLVRRLHDAGYSGWYFSLILIPYVGFIILWIILLKPSKLNTNNKKDIINNKHTETMNTTAPLQNKWTKHISLNSIYRKSISFHVIRFEEWQAGHCIDQGSLTFDLHLIANQNKIYGTIPYNDRFRIHNHIEFPFDGSHILSDRIQYVNAPGNSTDPTRPIVLHIFVKDNKINCIRIAMSFPDRIIEFYGHQIISDYSKPDRKNDETNNTQSDKQRKLTFLSSLLNIASCDGDITEVEMSIITAWMQREELNEDDLKKVIFEPQSISSKAYLDINLRIQHLRDAVMLAMSDGRMNPKEYELCKYIARGFGLKPEIIDVIREEINKKIGTNI